jgi:hypothetical protein
MAAGDLVLEYTGSLSNDNLPKTARRYFKAVSKTLAVDPKSGPVRQVYIHANSNVTLRRGTKDVSKYYAVRRLMRVWSAPLDAAAGTRAGAYQLNQKLAPDSAEKPLGDWIDAPGTVLIGRQTQDERVLYEWIVGGETSYRTLVEGLGGLYLLMTLDLTPGQYKLAMARAINLIPADVEAAFATGNAAWIPANAPWKTEDDIPAAGWLDRHTAWQAYGAYNAQLPLPTP